MSSSFQGIQTMSAALSAFQQELNVTGNNISNVNTTGYSRQRASLTEAVSTTTWLDGHMISVGNGVNVAAVARIRDMFLQAQSQGVSSDVGAASTLNTALSSVQSALGEDGTNGVSTALSAFFNAWSSLSSNPSSTAAQLQVQQAGQSLVNRVNTLYSNLQQISTSQTSTANKTIQNIQSDMNTLAKLNTQIVDQEVNGSSPNDLLDQRDQVLQDLSSMVNITTQTQPNGSMNVYSGELTLVDPSGASTFPTTWNAATNSVTNGATSYPITSGSLKGSFDAINDITSYQSKLDTLATTLTTQVNTLYQTATNSAGTTGANFFASTTTGAGNFSLDPAIAASAGVIASGSSGNSGDGTLALQISNLSTTAMAGLGGISPTSYYTDFVDQVGSDAKTASGNVSTQTAKQTQVSNQIQSISGVSLDDEMSSLLQFQRSYQAAAKTLTTFDQVTQTLIAMLER